MCEVDSVPILILQLLNIQLLPFLKRGTALIRQHASNSLCLMPARGRLQNAEIYFKRLRHFLPVLKHKNNVSGE
jgi:hypothetical protein